MRNPNHFGAYMAAVSLLVCYVVDHTLLEYGPATLAHVGPYISLGFIAMILLYWAAE